MELGNIQVQSLGVAGPGPAPARPSPRAPPAVLTGTVTADAQRTESISSRVAGRIEKLYVRQTGQLLRRGEPLFAVYSEELQTLQREYLLALAQDLQVPEPTYRHFAEATAQKLRLLGVSAAQLRQLAQRGKPSPLLTYYSPRTGTVQTLAVTQGQYVAEGSPLLTLTDLSQRVGRSPALPRRCRPAAGGHVGSRAGSGPGPPPARPRRVPQPRAERQQPGHAGPHCGAQPGWGAAAGCSGQRAAAQCPARPLRPRPPRRPPPLLRVPQAAIIHDGAASYLWKQTGERQFRRVRVRTGEGTAATVPVQAGVQPGDQVVITGAYLLESEHYPAPGSCR